MRLPSFHAIRLTFLALSACARPTGHRTGEDAVSITPVDAGADRRSVNSDLPECSDPPPGSQRLESYWDVRVPASYWLEMTFDGNEWLPAEQLPMPRHHATRLELTNLAEYPALSGHRNERLRFTIEITSREIREVPGRREWRATYRARILGVCVSRSK